MLFILFCVLAIAFLPANGFAKSEALRLTSRTLAEAPAAHYSSVLGHTYYVAPWGNNANPGTSSAPWATPGYGSRQLQPGDTLIILGGRYILSVYDDDIVTPPSGTANAWVTIKGEEGNRPVLAGRDDLFAAISLVGASYVRIENLEITHDSQASGEGLYFRTGIAGSGAPVSHIVLKDLYIHHIDEGAMDFQDVDDMQVIDCRMEYCGFGALGGPAAEYGGWRNVRIQGCRLSWSGHYYRGGDGSARPYDRPDGFGIEPSSGPIEIVDTVAEHNYGDGLDSKAANTTIRRCIVANNSCDGVKLWDTGCRIENTLIYGRGDGDPQTTPWSPIVVHTERAGATFEIVNCTVDDTLGANYLMHVQYDMPHIPLNLTLKNTIFRGTGECSTAIFIGQASTLLAQNNLFYMPNIEYVLEHGTQTYTASNIAALGTGNRYGDPRFVAPAWGSTGDYHLRAGSPAINAGTTSGAPSDDLDGRPRDALPDIGAYEWVGGTPSPSPVTATSTRTATPGRTSTPTRTLTPTRTRTAGPTIPTRTPPRGPIYLPVIIKGYAQPSSATLNPNPPASPVKLIFIHHSTGEGWLADEDGGLGLTLRDNRYFVSDTNYGWGPDSIGDYTDIGHWWNWFRGANRDAYMAALYNESGQNCSYSRLPNDPGGQNQIVIFKSCFPNSHLGGNANDPPTTGSNPLRGQDAGSEHMTVGNAKGIYNDILSYFATRQDKLFIVITASPLVENSTDPAYAANARAFNNWLVRDWLDGYPYKNVAVFDFYNVLTSNGSNASSNDLGWASGNHHRWWNGAVQHVQSVANNYAAYGSDEWDSHPTAAGGRKASAEFAPLLNIAFHCWQGDGGCPSLMGRETP